MPILARTGLPDLHYEIDDFTDPWTNAPAILLQHGYGRSTRFWYRWIPYLSRFFRVIRADLRGLGQSSQDFDPHAALSLESYLADLDAVLDAAGAPTVHYVGESLGGILGLIYAATRPERIRSVNLVSTPLFLDTDFQNRSAFGHASWEDALRSMGARGYAEAKNNGDRFAPGTDPGLMNFFAEQQGASNVEVLIAMQKLARQIDARPYLARVAAPTLAIVPADGPIVTPAQIDEMRAGIGNLRLIRLPSRHHNLHLVQAATCATEVLHHAAQVEGIACREL